MPADESLQATDIKQTGINRYEYDLLVGFGNIDVDDTLDIHKYLTKKEWYKIILIIIIWFSSFSGSLASIANPCNYSKYISSNI